MDSLLRPHYEWPVPIPLTEHEAEIILPSHIPEENHPQLLLSASQPNEGDAILPVIENFPLPIAGAPVHQGTSQTSDAIYQENIKKLNPDSASSSQNIYTPFASKMDWEVAQWAKLRGASSTSFSDLLAIDGVCVFKN
jgi:hypothetical protein